MAQKFLNGIAVTGTGSFTDQVTIPETPTADAHAASKKYVDDQVPTGVDVAKRIEISVKNISGGQLIKGTVVHAAPSASPPSGNVVEVIAADYDAEANMPAIGILNETLADDGEGVAVMMGAVSGIDTDDFTAGDELYVGADGALTNTKPQTAGQLIQKIAVCVKSHASNGLIKVFGAGRSNDVPLPLYIDNTNQRLGIRTSTPNSVLDVHGSSGQLFSVTDDLSGDLFSVSDISGMPILNVNSSGVVDIDGNLNLGDSKKIQLGASQDLQIYHDGSHSYIQDTGTGNLTLSGTNLYLTSTDGQILFKGITDAETGLYYDNSLKLETTSTGVTVSGKISAITASGHAFLLGNSNNTTTADTSGFRLHQSSYTDGRYTHRFRKYDEGGGVPLYIDGSGSTANVFTALARFGTYTNEDKAFEVFGKAKATHFYGDGSNLTNVPVGTHNHDGDYIQDGGTTAIGNMNTIGTESIKHRWNSATTGRPASSQANEYGTVTTLTYDSTYATQLAWDIAQDNLYGRTLTLADDSGTWVKFAKDGDYVPASGGTFAGGVVNVNTGTNTNTLNISRSGGNASQVMKIGVTDTVATFNYIEDTTSEGNGNFGQYQFKLGGNDGESTVTALTITKTGISAPNLSGTNTGDQVLPTDFVSAANGGTFGGNVIIKHATSPSLTLTDDSPDPDNVGKIDVANNYMNFALDSSDGIDSSRMRFQLDGSNRVEILPNTTYFRQTNIHLQNTAVSNLNFRKDAAITAGDDIGKINFLATNDEGASYTSGGNIIYEGDGTWDLSSINNAPTRMKIQLRNSSGTLANAMMLSSNLNANFYGDLTVAGNLTVSGTTTTLNTETIEVEDNIIVLNKTASDSSATAATSGISIYRGLDANNNAVTQASLIFDDGDDTWDLTNNLTVAGDVISASFAVPSGASTGFLKADGSVDSTTYSGYTFGSSDLTFSGADPGDIVWRNADGDEVHRLWSGTNDYLTYRNDAGTAYELISAGSTSYNNTNWDTAYTHSQAAHAPTNAEANVYSTASELLTGLNTLANPIFTNGLSKKNSRYQDGITSEYPLGHYTPGETLFEIDTTWSNAELQSYFDTPNVSWDEVANAPGGYAIYITGSNGVGGPYSSGFPMIPIDQDATYYQECWIKNATSSTMGHYMGSADLEADRTAPDSGSGNPGSYGYWVMSNTNPGDTWTKVSGYITGHHASNTGAFENNATYFTPLALFNYTTPAAGTRACWISGWKVIRVDKVGDRIFQDDVQVKGKLEIHTLDTSTDSNTALVMNNNEVEKRSLGSLAFSNATIPTVSGVYLPLSGGSAVGQAMTGNLHIENGGPKIYLKDTTDDDDQAIYFQNNGGTVEYVISTQDFTQDGLLDGMFIGSISSDEVGLVTNNTTALYIDTSQNSKFFGNIKVNEEGLIDFAKNTDVDGAEVVGQVATATYTAAFFDYVIKKGANVRAGIVYACHDGSNNVEFSETSTTDLGDTSDVALSVDISSGNMRLIADSDSNDWSVKTLIRAI